MMSKNIKKAFSQKKLYLSGRVINSKESLVPYLIEKLSEYKSSYKEDIPKDHLIVFIDHFIEKATHTYGMNDQKEFLDKLKSIKKRILEE